MALRIMVLLLICLASGCAQFPGAVPSTAIPPRADSPLVKQLAAKERAHPGQSGFYLLDASTNAFTARAELIRKARYSLDIQYYIVHDGLTTRLLVAELLAAADRGVRVRVLIDDTSSDGMDFEIGLLDAHPNVEVRVFNPLHVGRGTGVTRNLGRLLNLSQQHRRMHNKLWLADGAVAIVGGRNLGDEYFDARPEMNFTDLDLMGAGPIARQLSNSFDQYWNSPISLPVPHYAWHRDSDVRLARLRRQLDRYLESERVRQSSLFNRLRRYATAPQLPLWLDDLTWANGRAIWDAPDKVLASGPPPPEQLLTTQLQPELDAVTHELMMVSSYFVPTAEGVSYLSQKAAQDVAVSVLTNSLQSTDVPAVHGGYAPYRRALLEHGVKLFELRARPEQQDRVPFGLTGRSLSSLHTKAVVMDRRKAFVGSFNLDPRSVLWNTEVGVIVDSPLIAEQVRAIALRGMSPAVSYRVELRDDRLVWVDEQHGQPRVVEHEPGGYWRRVQSWLVRTVGLERML